MKLLRLLLLSAFFMLPVMTMGMDTLRLENGNVLKFETARAMAHFRSTGEILPGTRVLSYQPWGGPSTCELATKICIAAPVLLMSVGVLALNCAHGPQGSRFEDPACSVATGAGTLSVLVLAVSLPEAVERVVQALRNKFNHE